MWSSSGRSSVVKNSPQKAHFPFCQQRRSVAILVGKPGCQEGFQRLDQLGDFPGGRRPDDLRVVVRICVNQQGSQTDPPAKGRFGIEQAWLIPKRDIDGFTDDPQLPFHG